MGEIINLNRRRKARVREAKEAAAAENRVLHGRTRAEKARDAAEATRQRAVLDGHRHEPPESGAHDLPPPPSGD